MTERQQLLGVLGLIYLSECIRWVRRGGIVFNSAPDPKAWRKSPLLNNGHGDAYLGWVLPLFGEFHVVRGLPFSLHSDGLLTFTAASLHTDGRPAQPVVFKSWSELAKTNAEGERLMCAGQILWRCDTPNDAGRLAQEIRGAAALDASARGEWIRRQSAAQFDVAAIRQRLGESRARLRPLRHVGAGLWTVMFLLMPLAVWRWGWPPALWFGVPLLACGCLWLAREVLRIHRDWFPSTGDDRFRIVLLTALSPVTAVRSAELLGRSRFEEFHPAAFALAALPRPAAEALCAALWRDLKHPRQPLPSLPAGQQSVESSWRMQTVEAFKAAATREGLEVDNWDKPPKRTEPNHARYCPRCHAQSTAQGKVCSDCGGMALIDLPA